MKIQQMAFMLMAVTLFFVLAGLFVFTVLFSGLKSSGQQVQQENAILLVSKMSNTPEFSCEGAFGSSRLNCIDEDKVMALKDDANKYSNFWGVQGIEIRKIFPEDNANVECTSANYPNCGIIKILSSVSGGTGVSNFVALCRKINTQNGFENKCELAELIVTYNA